MWRERMSAEQVAEYEAIAGDMLVRLGYDLASEAGEARAAEKGVSAPVGAAS